MSYAGGDGGPVTIGVGELDSLMVDAYETPTAAKKRKAQLRQRKLVREQAKLVLFVVKAYGFMLFELMMAVGTCCTVYAFAAAKESTLRTFILHHSAIFLGGGVGGLALCWVSMLASVILGNMGLFTPSRQQFLA
jgi:hypothetical protein